MQARRCMAEGLRVRAGAVRCTHNLAGSTQQLPRRSHVPRTKGMSPAQDRGSACAPVVCGVHVRRQDRARCAMLLHALPGGALASTSLASVSLDEEMPVKHLQRKERLTLLLELRRMYQNILHAKWCLQQPSPIYQPPDHPTQQGHDGDTSTPSSRHTLRDASGGGSVPAYIPSQGGSGEASPAPSPHTTSLSDVATYSSASSDGTASIEDEKERDRLEQERRNEALAAVAEMQLTSELLKASLRALPQGFGWVFGSGEVGSREEERVRGIARDYAAQLRERVLQELPLLPFGGELQAQALIDARVNRFMRRPATSASAAESLGSAVFSIDTEATTSGPSPIERLEQAEKVAEAFVQRRIKPALRRAQQAQLGDLLRDSGSYLKGLWVRLNGGGRNGRRSGLEALGLPVPPATIRESEVAMSSLTLQLESLEQRLQDASKARETKLRRAGLSGRVQMAIQMKYGGLDADVLQLSRLLAVRALQLEMEYVYRSLEDEAVDASGYDLGGGVAVDLADRDASLGELALLIADFILLDEQLCALSAALRGTEPGAEGHGFDAPEAAPTPASGSIVGGGGAPGGYVGGAFGSFGAAATAAAAMGGTALTSAASAGRTASAMGAVSQAAEAAVAAAAAGDAAAAAAAAAAGPSLGIVGEDILEKLALEIPDFRLRTGVMDQTVFGNQGLSLTKVQLQSQEALGKVREAIEFLVRGVRLLGSDIANSGRLFTRAALGGTLKPREVSALRRTARDILTFIPFTIILIIPLTPLGHVLVFSLIQTYFPSFFPSCFTKRRQDIMVKYEELQRQLLVAQTQAEQAEEEAELARAAAAVARLTAPDETSATLASATSSGDEVGQGAAGGGAAAIAGGLAQGGAAAGASRRGSGETSGSGGAGSPSDAAGAGVSGGLVTEAEGGSPRRPPAAAGPGPGGLLASSVVPASGGQAGLSGNGPSSLPHVEKVKALEQEISEVLESVNMGETVDDEGDFLGGLHGGGGGGQPHNSSNAWQRR